MNRQIEIDDPTMDIHPERPEPQRLAVAERESVQSHARVVTVCQRNIREGGRWTGLRGKKTTYDTARRFARFVASVNPNNSQYPPIGVIGMQEISEADRDVIRTMLEEETGAEWHGERTAQGIEDDSGIGFFHRAEIVEPSPGGDMGELIVCRLDNDYAIKYAGRVFQTPGGERFALVTGKLPWRGAALPSRTVSDEDRGEYARALRSWIRERPAEPPPVTIIATDLNSGYRSPAWRELNVEYVDPSRRRTYNSFVGPALDLIGKRLDYLWLSRTRRAGFADGPRRSPHFGSDHRAVYGSIEFREEA